MGCRRLLREVDNHHRLSMCAATLKKKNIKNKIGRKILFNAQRIGSIVNALTKAVAKFMCDGNDKLHI